MIKAYNSVFKVAVKEVYKAKIVKKTADGKVPLEVALMQQVGTVLNQYRVESLDSKHIAIGPC